MEATFSEYFPYEHHAAALPDLENGQERKRHKVVIAGGGPTGLAVALGLANYGIPSVVLEADETICTGSRAGAFTRRTMEIFDRLGVSDAVLDTCLRWNEAWTFLGLTEIARLQLPGDETQKFPPSISQLQNYIEHCMVKEAERKDGLIDIRWQTRVTKVTSSNAGARLAVETPIGAYELDTDWLIACDGGQSTVRKELGLRMQGQRHVGRYVIIDIRVDNDSIRAGRHCWFNPPSLPGGTLLMYKQPRGMIRFDYQISEEEEAWASKPEEVLKRVQKHLDMIGITGSWEPVWISLYRASALTLERYRYGRVLFCGDAAHLVPIFGVRGMNSAVEDAHNLAWKLAFVIKGLTNDELLDGFSAERHFAALGNMRYASQGAEFMSPPTTPHRIIRDAVLSLAQDTPALRELIIPRQHAATPLTESPLTMTDEPGAFAAGPVPGAVLPECPLRIGRNGSVVNGHLTDLLGPHFTALYFGETAEMPAPLKKACQSFGEKFPLAVRILSRGAAAPEDMSAQDETGRLFTLYDAQPGTLYLVRPDGHVMGRWKQAQAHHFEAALKCLPTSHKTEALSA
ncbi:MULTISPECIES: FAD-dependent monooxygenase [unclassified Beijerinckia]|uniref:FAD-dependent monooxygenase n=1 Tax=unclassified Beijerinckia TaxID=2638183 RepID=UPI000895A6C4|nr:MULTISPECIES: FAD-dependent monooxygenase [unclassified Beijerinckia]MDH7799151.1 3-(3-hydroxy-phenyl)propionate hydroxylase [Beijerinckia sp. GAS462]SED93546.1 3-(3-hydroxy-phenyl)propionate hydroxylase [Beijerinckia sp. 28-YEA-48]